MLAMHENRKAEGKDPILFIAEGGKAKKPLIGTAIDMWEASLKKGSKLLVTSAHPTDPRLCKLADRGVEVYYANWHKTGIAKDLEPEEIAEKFSLLPQEMLYRFNPASEPVRELRFLVDMRNYLIFYRIKAANKRDAILRGRGLSTERVAREQNALKKKRKLEKIKKLPAFMKEADDELALLMASSESDYDREITELAKSIQDCRTFNRVFGMKNAWISAAEVVVRIGNVSRFETVSSLWHYAGFHVVDGHAPRRKKGDAVTWNPKLKTALWRCIDAGLKNNVPLIREMYEKFRAIEFAVHDEKHPNCKTKVGHCGARARRRVIKELLINYYNATGGVGKPRAMAVAAD